MASWAQFELMLGHFETWQKNINNITAKNDENFLVGQFHLLLKVEEGTIFLVSGYFESWLKFYQMIRQNFKCLKNCFW